MPISSLTLCTQLRKQRRFIMESLHIHQDSNYNFSSIVSKIKVPEDLPAWASEITQLKVMADKLDDLNSIPETHTVEGEKINAYKFSFDLHTYTYSHVCVRMHTHRELHRHTQIHKYIH